MKLREKTLLFVAVPLLVSAIAISVLVSKAVTFAMEQQIQNSLQATVYVYRDAIADNDKNDYHLDADGVLWNGDSYNVTEDTEMPDLLIKETGISLTIFYGDTRAVTSFTNKDGEKLVGSKASEKVVEQVLKGGKEYFAKDIVIEENVLYGYYVPLYNGDGSIVGMVFAGAEKSVVNSAINQVVAGTAVPAIVLFVLSIVSIFFITKGMIKRFSTCASTLEKISEGDLTVDIPENILKNKDESGTIGRACKELKNKLTGTISDIIEKSENVDGTASSLGGASEKCANVINQVENAVNDVAVGATSQATDTETATERVIEMGNLVEETNNNVNKLTEISNEMESSGKKANGTLEKLEKVNAEAKEAIDVIYEQTNTTNVSAQKINEAVNLITEIADETNLLSLNASIEAARAGEAGRGFAVVAAQIQKLAEQSNESAKTIEEIISALISDSAKSVETMDKVKEIMDRQSDMVSETEKTFGEVIIGIKSSRDGIKDISTSMTELNKVRGSVVDIVTNLSSIAEENAAATEEASSSVTQVSASVQQVSASAASLKEIADQLNSSVNSFKIK